MSRGVGMSKGIGWVCPGWLGWVRSGEMGLVCPGGGAEYAPSRALTPSGGHQDTYGWQAGNTHLT